MAEYDIQPDTLRDELAATLGEALGPAGDHPDESELLAYSQCDLDDAASDRVAEHLTSCNRCLDQVLDLEGFLAPQPEDAAPAQIQTARAWRDLRSALPASFDSAPPVARTRAASPPAWRSLALAASLLLALGLGALALHQQRTADQLRDRIERLDAPQPDAPIVDLFPSGTVRAGDAADGTDVAPVESDAGFVILVLNLPGDADHPEFSAELLGAGGEILWSGPLQRSAYGTFRLGVPRHWLGSGERQLRLYGIRGEAEGAADERELLETFALPGPVR